MKDSAWLKQRLTKWVTDKGYAIPHFQDLIDIADELDEPKKPNSLFDEEEPETIKRTLPHAAIRAKERYGIDLTNDDLREMAKICQDKTWRRDYRKNLGKGKHNIHVNYKDIWFNCIWSSNSGIIVSILDIKQEL